MMSSRWRAVRILPFRSGMGGCSEQVRIVIEQLSRPRTILATNYAIQAALPTLVGTGAERSPTLRLASGSAV